ncbi:MAG TPA: hypothetical protein VFE05_02700 [Longimicrobiaceae bacterium]|jgi:hypothetical protein|nr:hypothetical protein [Longimicrobiaceae bacterium]
MKRRERVGSPFSTVLDTVFGSEASVRIVRELCLADAPLSRAEIARRTGLSLPGVGSATAKLHRASVVEFVGTGARQSVQMRPRHPFTLHLRMLFFVERGYAETVIDTLRSAVAGVSPAPRSAWLEPIEGPAAPAILTVLVGARDVPVTREQLRQPLRETQDELDVTIELNVVTEADVETAEAELAERWKQATLVYGQSPAGLAVSPARASGPRTHRNRDMASLHRAVWIAQRLEHDPTLLKRARQWLVTHLPSVSTHEEHELQEWLDILHGASVPRIQHVLSDPGERGQRLRQSNPFVQILSRSERSEMRKEIAL